MTRWFYLGGDESRTARHEAFWIALGSVMAGLGALLRFASHGADHIVGWILMAVAAWIGLAFFFPLWLPRVRDADVIKARRAKDTGRRAAAIQSLRDAQETYERQRKDIDMIERSMQRKPE